MREGAFETCRRSWQTALSACVLLTLAVSLQVETRRLSDLGVDESEWVTASHVAWELLRAGAPPERWASAFAERQLGDWGNNNPPVLWL